MLRRRYGKGGKCSLMRGWWDTVPAEQKPFIKQRQAEYPHMRPCPKARGYWVRIEDVCDCCKHAVFEPQSSSETSTIGKGNEEIKSPAKEATNAGAVTLLCVTGKQK